MIFTRYLYCKDEVELSFLDSLLKQKSIDECYFWIYELYKSGFSDETWSFLWRIYYDFYGLTLPKMSQKIIKNHNMWKKEKNIEFVLDIVKNYFRYANMATHTIFILRIYYSERLVNALDLSLNELSLDSLTRNQKNKINIEHCIETDNNEGLSFYLKKLCKTDVEWVKTRFNIEINHLYEDLHHQILFNLMMINQEKKIYYKKVMKKEIQKVIETDKNYRYEGKYSDASKCPNLPAVSYVHKTLPNVRLYSISNNIGCFQLDRKNFNIKEMFWYHWEYFAYRSPIWQERFNKLDIVIDHENKKIVFNNEDQEEEFYEEYNYEPDEQSKEVQEKSVHDIKKSTLSDWINTTFTDKINFKIRRKMVYM